MSVVLKNLQCFTHPCVPGSNFSTSLSFLLPRLCDISEHPMCVLGRSQCRIFQRYREMNGVKEPVKRARVCSRTQTPARI